MWMEYSKQVSLSRAFKSLKDHFQDIYSPTERDGVLELRYELQHVVRTHMGAQDNSYGCVFQREDEAGKVSYIPQPFSSLF